MSASQGGRAPSPSGGLRAPRLGLGASVTAPTRRASGIGGDEGTDALCSGALRGPTRGWPARTAHGVATYGIQMDAIGATGNLFFKGFFLLLLGLSRYVSGDDKWNRPFETVRDGSNTFTWTHSGIAEFLAAQWNERPAGCHCENTKIWPY